MWSRTLFLLAAGCGGSDSKLPDARIDAPPPDAGCAADTCNPLTSMGCTASQKCTWIVQMNPPRTGITQCSFAGAVPIGVTCTRDATGADGCVKDSTCYMDKCAAICDVAGGTSNCGVGLTCRATALFVPCAGGAPLAGLCVP
ncbi:MAG: hypothetical protein ABI175_28810 [Polyangiales bacterium]